MDRKSWWLHHIRQWHWVSSALCLIGLLLFAVTGITLNRAHLISAKADITSWEKPLPTLVSPQEIISKQLSAQTLAWLTKETNYKVKNYNIEWSEDELYISMPSPGADAWLSIRLAENNVEFEESQRGMIAFLNDLHKGRNSGEVWKAFIDVLAIACIIFTLTGLFLLIYYQKQRQTTWPFVSTGLVVPLILILLFIHF